MTALLPWTWLSAIFCVTFMTILRWKGSLNVFIFGLLELSNTKWGTLLHVGRFWAPSLKISAKSKIKTFRPSKMARLFHLLSLCLKLPTTWQGPYSSYDKYRRRNFKIRQFIISAVSCWNFSSVTQSQDYFRLFVIQTRVSWVKAVTGNLIVRTHETLVLMGIILAIMNRPNMYRVGDITRPRTKVCHLDI